MGFSPVTLHNDYGRFFLASVIQLLLQVFLLVSPLIQPRKYLPLKEKIHFSGHLEIISMYAKFSEKPKFLTP